MDKITVSVKELAHQMGIPLPKVYERVKPPAFRPSTSAQNSLFP
jgi:hypothetical protein